MLSKAGYSHTKRRTGSDAAFYGGTFMSQLREKLATTDIKQVKQDVIGFVDNPHELDIWSNDYFLQLADKMIIKEY